MRHHDSLDFSWSVTREGSPWSILPVISPASGTQRGWRTEGMLLGSQDVSWQPEDPQISQWSLLFPGHSLKRALNKDRIAPGEHLRVRHITLIFPPSTISNEHREPSLCSSEKALQLAGLFETRGSTAVSQQPFKWLVPRPWFIILVEKKIHQHLWQHWLFHPQCRRHKKPTINKQH